MSSWVCMSPLSGPFNTKGREREREIKPFGKTLLAKSKSCPSPTHLANKCFRATVFSDNRISLEQEPFLSVMSRRRFAVCHKRARVLLYFLSNGKVIGSKRTTRGLWGVHSNSCYYSYQRS